MKKLILFIFAVSVWAQTPLASPISGGGSGSGGTGCIPGGSVGVVQASDGAGACQSTSITDNGTTVTTTEPLQAPSYKGTNTTGSTLFGLPGLTSGSVWLGSADIAGTAITYVLPSTNGAASQVLVDSGSTTCPTTPTGTVGAPATCHQLQFLNTAFSAQTDAATVTWAIGSALIANASLTFTVHSGSRTLNITNPVNGGSYQLKLIQDGTGGEGLTLGTGCTWKVVNGGSGAVTLSATASAVDTLAFTYDGTNCIAALGKNFN